MRPIYGMLFKNNFKATDEVGRKTEEITMIRGGEGRNTTKSGI